MKGDARGQLPPEPPHAPEARHTRPQQPASSPLIDDQVLRSYLADTLPPEELARVEKALRDSATLRARLEDVRNNREDFQLHSLGAIWLRSRLTCPGRQQLGSYLLDALEPELASYIKFHIEVVECPYCQANLVDLDRQQSGHSMTSKDREQRFLNATRDLLGEEGRGR